MSSLWHKVQSLFDGVIFSWSWKFWGVKELKPETPDVMLIERQWFTDKSTVGMLSLDGVHVCFTLEDTCRRKKEHGTTAIPAGRYEVIVDYSERFRRLMPHILNVPFFEGVRIHSGNTPEDTDGCVLVGLRKGENAVYDSVKAYGILFDEIQRRLSKGKLYVSIIGGISKEQFSA